MNADQLDREPDGAGHVGPLLRARCTSCDAISLKRTERVVGETSSGSFKHVCHKCRGATWWNVLEVVEEVESE
jgi:hypothetical protein